MRRRHVAVSAAISVVVPVPGSPFKAPIVLYCLFLEDMKICDLDIFLANGIFLKTIVFPSPPRNKTSCHKDNYGAKVRGHVFYQV